MIVPSLAASLALALVIRPPPQDLARPAAVQDPPATASFSGLGFLASGDQSIALGLSADGRTVVGRGTIGDAVQPSLAHAFVWTAESGLTALVDPAGPADASAQAVSADGSVVVGTSGAHAFRWTSAGGMADLGAWYALGVSADGGTIVGWRELPLAGRVGVRWTQAGGLEDLGTLPGDTVDAFLADASADGGVLVGQSMTFGFEVEPTLWTPAGGLVGLGDLPGGPVYALGFALSDDGNVAAGWAISDVGVEAFRWTGGAGLQSLDPVASRASSNMAHGISADGQLVAGTAEHVGGAALWDEAHGFRSVRALLAAQDVDVGAWTLGQATAVERTPRGIVVAGHGTDPDGRTQAWRAHLPSAP